MAASEAGLVWHYTDGDALMSILTKHELWAGSAAFMNDTNELLSGAMQLRQHFEAQRDSLSQQVAQDLEQYIPDVKRRARDSFVLSASSDGDSLTMWRYYGRDQVSFAIGLDRTVPLVPLARCEGDKHPNPSADYYNNMYALDDEGQVLEYPNGAPVIEDDPDRLVVDGNSWKPVIYDRETQTKLIKEIFNNLREGVEKLASPYGDHRRTIWMYPFFMNETLDLIKNEGFLDEREERVAVWVNPEWKFVSHRPGPFGLVPFIRLTALDGFNAAPYESSYAVSKGRLPIREIRIGPTPYSAEAVTSLSQLLDFHGLHEVKVSYSQIPFRQ